MRKSQGQLSLKIEQGESVVHRILARNDSISVGQHPYCDITIYGKHFPKRHILFAGRNNHFQIYLKDYMRGEVIADKSRLSFHDMLAHGLLPPKGDDFLYHITAGKNGVVQVGDARITFQCTAEPIQKPARFAGFSWGYATAKELTKDWPFKTILVFMIVLHVFLMKYISGFPIDINSRIGRNNIVPERLARIIVRNPGAGNDAETKKGVQQAADEPVDSGEDETTEAAEPSGSARPETQGVLGLLTGLGTADQSNNLADFLLDKGLAKELDEVISDTRLTVGNGKDDSSGTSAFDELFAATDLAGSIDDVVKTTESVDNFSLGRKGQIQIDQVGGMRGSEAALGKRSEESVRSVLRSYQGRLTYIYNKYLKRHPDLQGKMVVEVIITARGTVSKVKLISSSMGQPDFEREVLNFVRKWKYASIDQGQVTVTYPLFFSKVG